MSQAISPSVILAADDPQLLDELIRHLEEHPHWRLIASVGSVSEMKSSVHLHNPDAVIVSESLAVDYTRDYESSGDISFIVVTRRETTEALKTALEIGAKGLVIFPGDGLKLKQLVEVSQRREPQLMRRTGELISVWSPKGGSGSSVLSAHLAGALGRINVRSALIDLDFDNADQTAITGAPAAAKTLADLIRMSDELSPSVLDSVAFENSGGFKVFLSPGQPGQPTAVSRSQIVRIITAIREFYGLAIADLPAGYSENNSAVIEESHRLLIVVTCDYLSLRRARDCVSALDAAGLNDGRIEVVINKLIPGDITPADVEAVLGRPPRATIRLDNGLERAPDKGELSVSGMRLMEPLARHVAGLPEVPTSGLKRFLSRI